MWKLEAAVQDSLADCTVCCGRTDIDDDDVVDDNDDSTTSFSFFLSPQKFNPIGSRPELFPR